MYNQKKDDSIFWLVFCLIILAPFVMLSSNKEVDEMDKRRKLSNKIGLFVLFTMVLGAIGTRVIYHFVEKEEIGKTQVLLNKTAESFASHDSEVIMSWAKGEIKDSWGQSVILVNNDETGIILVSKGKDGEFMTTDDIQGTASWHPKAVPSSPLKPMPKKKKTIGQKIRGLFGGN